MTDTNMKPADEFLQIKQKIKELKAREAELRDGFLAGDLDVSGDFSAIRLTQRKAKKFDRKSAELRVGDLSRFDLITTSNVVIVEELQNPDAA